jgi:hypothetical protein
VVLVDADGRAVGEIARERVAEGRVTAADAHRLERALATSATLREALSVMMADSLRPLVVLDGDGKVAGAVSIELINRALQAKDAN